MESLICLCEKTFSKKQEYIDHARNCFKGLKNANLQIICAICKRNISSPGYFIKTHLNFHEGNILLQHMNENI